MHLTYFLFDPNIILPKHHFPQSLKGYQTYKAVFPRVVDGYAAFDGEIKVSYIFS